MLTRTECWQTDPKSTTRIFAPCTWLNGGNPDGTATKGKGPQGNPFGDPQSASGAAVNAGVPPTGARPGDDDHVNAPKGKGKKTKGHQMATNTKGKCWYSRGTNTWVKAGGAAAFSPTAGALKFWPGVSPTVTRPAGLSVSVMIFLTTLVVFALLAFAAKYRKDVAAARRKRRVTKVRDVSTQATFASCHPIWISYASGQWHYNERCPRIHGDTDPELNAVNKLVYLPCKYCVEMKRPIMTIMEEEEYNSIELQTFCGQPGALALTTSRG